MFTLFFFALAIFGSRGEYTSLPRLMNLAKTEATVKAILDDYIMKEEQKVLQFKEFSQKFDIRVKNDQLDIETKIGNPIGVYSLITRLLDFTAFFLPKIKEVQDKEAEFFEQISSLEFPTEDDVRGVLETVLMLQQTYNLSSDELSKGKILGKKYGKMLPALDCYQLGVFANSAGYLRQSVEWLKISRRSSEPSHLIKWGTSINLIMADSLYKLGKYKEGLEHINEALKKEPSNADYLNYKRDFESVYNETKPETTEDSDIAETKIEKLCRNQYVKNDTAPLKCFYKFKKHPFLIIAPLKMEQVTLGPDIFIFHDVLSDREISILKGVSFQKLKPSFIGNHSTHSYMDLLQTSSSAFIYDDSNKIASVISQRVSDMTDLSVKHSEPLKITHYGVGGYSQLQVDFFKKEYKEQFNLADRTATVLFQLSDIEQGGVLIFPELNTAILPRKGTALFWYNLHSNGEGDMRTLHGECPVLLGSKWIATKWISERDQNFQTPRNVAHP